MAANSDRCAGRGGSGHSARIVIIRLSNVVQLFLTSENFFFPRTKFGREIIYQNRARTDNHGNFMQIKVFTRGLHCLAVSIPDILA